MASGKLNSLSIERAHRFGGPVSAMINYNNYVYLRYALLVNIIAALVPSMTVKGRANDPLLH